ncbi:nucleolar RNA helicase II, partial [Trypanosoma cruzi]
MGVHAYIQWAHYVCASWGEVRARVHARGHTHREREGRVCVRAVHGSLSLTLTRPPPQQLLPHTQHKKKQKREAVWETAVLPSLSPVVAVVFFMAVASTGVSFGLASLFSFCFPLLSLHHQLLGHRLHL